MNHFPQPADPHPEPPHPEPPHPEPPRTEPPRTVEALQAELQRLQQQLDASSVRYDDMMQRHAQARSALKRSEERFRRLTELSSDWYWEQDAEFRFVQITGDDAPFGAGSAVSSPGSRLWEIGTIRQPAAGWSEHMSMLEAQLPFHDLELQTDDVAGRARWISISGVPFFGKRGVFMGYRGIGRDISAARRSATLRQEALERLQKIASRLPGVVFQYRLRRDHSGCYPFASDALRDLFGVDPQAVRENEQAIARRIHPDDRDRLRLCVHQSAHDLKPWQQEFRIRRADGSERWVASNAIPEREPGGSTLWNGFATDITEHKCAQEAIRTALREKSALLQEVHHRVKNNLQVVVSMLRLEARRSRDGAVKLALDDMQGRIRAMALLHESLYRTDVFASVRLEHYLRELATQSFGAAEVRDNPVRLKLDLAPVRVGLHQGTPCGLILNELVSNCFKHGLADGRGGFVAVSLQPMPDSPLVRLQVSDSGPGFPPGFTGQTGDSLGLQLVADLCQQLDGSLEFGPGSTVTLLFTPEGPAGQNEVAP